jgi:hypothetical protein
MHENLIGKDVEAKTYDDPEHNTTPQDIVGTLSTRWVEPLQYTQYLVDDEIVDPSTIKPAF